MMLALIPARGGSQRLPRKNIKMMAGRPLIAWTILAAQRAPVPIRVAVSTEDDEIADVARDYGCQVIKRPYALARNASSVYGTIQHAIDAVGGCEAVCLLQPTSPLRTAEDIQGCVAPYVDRQRQVVSAAIGELIPNGAIYIASSQWLADGGNWDDGTSVRYEMPKDRSIDINTLADFEAAETAMAKEMIA